MKKIFSIFFYFVPLFTFGTDYYLSSSLGNDSNAGTSSNAPWASLNKLNAEFKSMHAGDHIYIKRGDVFYGNIIIARSGTATNPIVIDAYGSGALPVITGFTNISSWTRVGKNIWESADAIGTENFCNMVMIDSVNTAMGRTPNTGSYYNIDARNGNTQITSSSLNAATDWTGATIVIRSINTFWHNGQITSMSGSTLNYGNTPDPTTPHANYKFFIQNDARTLDIQNEWYYDRSTKKLKIYSTTEPGTVSAASVANLIMNGGFDYIRIRNLALIGASNDAIYNSAHASDGISVQHCYIRFCGSDGYENNPGGGTNDTLIDNTIQDCGNTGIALIGTSPYIANNYIRNIGIILGQSNYNLHCLGIQTLAPNSVITGNTIINTGSAGISISNISTVKYNYIDSTVLRLDDMGGIYIGYRGSNSEISYNIVRHAIGFTEGTTNSNATAEGIYLDEGDSMTYIHHNTCEGNQDYGLKLHSTTAGSHNSNNNRVENNLFYNNGNGQVFIQNTNKATPMTGNIFRHNTLFCGDEKQYALKIQDQYNIPEQMIISNQNYFVQPFAAGRLIAMQTSSSSNNYDLPAWQSATSQDLQSTTSSKKITDKRNLMFIINNSSAQANKHLNVDGTDAAGLLYTGHITLPPYGGKVLFVKKH